MSPQHILKEMFKICEINHTVPAGSKTCNIIPIKGHPFGPGIFAISLPARLNRICKCKTKINTRNKVTNSNIATQNVNETGAQQEDINDNAVETIKLYLYVYFIHYTFDLGV